METAPSSGWFAVRCLFRCGWPPPVNAEADHRYEERITLWNAHDIDEAIAMAEAEAEAHAAVIDDAPSAYLGLAQAYALYDSPDHGAEVFSLIRSSALDPGNYLDTFFDTGREHQHSGPPS